MKKGEIWWAKLPAPVGRRPVLLLSRDEAYHVRSSVTVIPLTTTIRNIPVETPLLPKDGVPRECVINCDDILTIKKDFLEKKITSLSPEKLKTVYQAMIFAFDLPFFV